MFDILTSVFEGFFNLLVELVSLIFGSFSKKKGYHADFAMEGILLSRRNKGFCLTGRKNISVKDSYTNCLAIGGTGSGKTSVVLLPSLYSMQSSFVIHDPSGELYQKSAGHLASRGYAVKTLHFSKPEISSGYNPLARAKTSSEIQKVASLLVSNALGNNSKDPFWNMQAVSLLSILIGVLKKQSTEFCNLYNVRQLLNRMTTEVKDENESNPVDALFSRYATEEEFAEYKSFISMDQKLMSSVIATCKAAVTFVDESVARVTASDTIDFSDFRKKPTALFIQNSIADQKYYAVLTSIFFEQFFSYVLSRFPEKDEQDIFFLIDECSSLRLPTLPLAVANVRKHRGGVMLIVQDFNQLVHSYGKPDAEAIRANCFAKLFFTGASFEMSKELEQAVGRFEYKDKDGKKEVRPLLTNDEIRTLPQNRALLICGHHAPILARLCPYYKTSRYGAYSAIAAPLQNGETQASVPVLPLNSADKE